MAKFRADVAEERTYPTLGIVVKPNDIVELPADTDAAGLVLIEGKSTKAVNSATEPVAKATELDEV